MPKTADVVIIGAGIIGLSIGFELKKRGVKKVVILEKEIMPGIGETSKATGGIRLQFSNPENIKMALIGLETYEGFKEIFNAEIDFRKNGYLFLATCGQHLEVLKKGIALQREFGIKTDILTRSQIQEIIPDMVCDDIAAGSICGREGHADPSLAVSGYAAKFKKIGGELLTENLVKSIELKNNRVCCVKTDKDEFAVPSVVNAAGPSASLVAAMVNLALPVKTFKRHVVATSPVSFINENIPLVIDMQTGWYMKKEAGGSLLMGGTDRDGVVSTEMVEERAAIESIVEAAIKRVPKLADAGIAKSYVGLRSMSPDDLPILGESKKVKGFYCANGFSGHGFMHAPAVGKIIADLVINERTDILDIANFSPDRFSGQSSLKEAYVF